MISNEIINKTNFFYTNLYASTAMNEYYNMLCSLLKKIFFENDFQLSVNFGNQELKKEINLDFQFEQVILEENGLYKHDIHRYDYLKNLDCIFEYTETNVSFLSQFKHLSHYVKKNIYVPPLIYDEIDFHDYKDRYLDFTTLQSWSERRGRFYNKRKHNNIDGSYDKNYLKQNLDKYKILLNIHQTDNRKSFEELRVLPSLSTGILVVSEEVPFKESIPYHNHIIWSSYENLEKTLDEVLNNYDYFRESKLTRLSETLQKMKEISEHKLINFFKKYDSFYNSVISL